MKKVLIIVHSKTGITRMYAEEIEEYLLKKGLEVTLVSIRKYRNGMYDNSDYLLMGCWTSGLMVFFQHPDREWREFAAGYKNSGNPKTILFTTYKILTGSMFRNMLKRLNGKISNPFAELKSRNGSLSEKDKKVLDEFVSR